MADEIKFRCKACEKKIAVRAEYAGKKVKCPGCQQPLRVPSPRPKRSATGAPVAAGASSELNASEQSGSGYSMADLLAMEANADAPLKELSTKATNRASVPRIAGGKDCPGCGSSVKPDAVLCVHCGHNFESGKKLKTKKQKAPKGHSAVSVEQPGANRGLNILLGSAFTILSFFIIGAKFTHDPVLSAKNPDNFINVTSTPIIIFYGLSLLLPGISLIWIGSQKYLDYQDVLIRIANIAGGAMLVVMATYMIIINLSSEAEGYFNLTKALVIAPIILVAGAKMILNGAFGRAIASFGR